MYHNACKSRGKGDTANGTAERRLAIMRALCKRRHDTIPNLAIEFDVSERTMRRDVEILSLTEPIYTVPGRYGGGVYVIDSYKPSRFYLSVSQTAALENVLFLARNKEKCELSKEDIEALSSLLKECARPI